MFGVPIRLVISAAPSTTLLSCESTDRMIAATEQALASRTGRIVLAVVQSKDPSKAVQHRLDHYAQDPDRLLNDLRAAQRDFQTLYKTLNGKVAEKWGQKEVKLPERNKYVKYTQSYKSRAVVDFDTYRPAADARPIGAPRDRMSHRRAIISSTRSTTSNWERLPERADVQPAG